MKGKPDVNTALDRARRLFLSGEHMKAVGIYISLDPKPMDAMQRLEYLTGTAECAISLGTRVQGLDLWKILGQAEREAAGLVRKEAATHMVRALALYAVATILGIEHIESEELSDRYRHEAEKALNMSKDILDGGTRGPQRHRNDRTHGGEGSPGRLSAVSLLHICWARVLINAGDWEAASGHGTDALQSSRKALEAAKGADHDIQWMDADHYLAESHRVLGDIYFNSGEPALAQKSYKRAFRAFEELGDTASMAMMAGAVADSKLEDGEYDGALKWYDISRNHFEEIGLKHGAWVCNMKKGMAYLKKGEPGKARKLLGRVVRKLKKIGASSDAIMASIGLLECSLMSKHKWSSKQKLLDLLYNEPVKQYPECYNYLYEVVSAHEWIREDKELSQLFGSSVRYTVSRKLMDDVIEQAKRHYPNEFGAVLHGREHIESMEFVLDSAQSHNSVVFNLFSRYSQRRITGDGVVHSHPSGSARPSRADVSLFGRFPGVNIIIAYPFTYESWAAYDMLGNRVSVEMVEHPPDQEKGKKKGRKLR